MYSLNYAGVVFGKSYNEVVRDLIADNEWSVTEPFHIKLNNADQAVSSVVSKSVDSMELSGLITLLHDNGIPHRLFSVPRYDSRVMESFAARGERLVIHHRPRDMLYQTDFPKYGEGSKHFGLINLFTSQLLNGRYPQLKSIVVVGPHYESRSLYRWLDFTLRSKPGINHDTYNGMVSRFKDCKVYMKTHDGVWYVFYRDIGYVGEVTGVLDTECFVAKINGFGQYGVVVEDFDYDVVAEEQIRAAEKLAFRYCGKSIAEVANETA